MKKQKPISDDSKKKSSVWARLSVGLFGMVFVTVGLAVFYFFGLKPYLQKLRSADWPTAECKIEKADTEVHDGDDSNTYSVNFEYTFKVNGQSFTGTRYSFADANGRRSESRRQQKAFPVGSSRDCFYNPQDPSDCVLDRTNQDQGWMPLTLPLIFVAVGGIVAYIGFFAPWAGDKKSISGSIKSKKTQANYGGTNNALAATLGGLKVISDNPADQLDAEWAQPQKLKPANSRLGGAIGVTIFALFWNCFVVAFVYISTDGLRNVGMEQIFIGLFMIPFMLVGLVMIFLSIYGVMAIFNPKVEIALSSGAVPLGGTVDVAWQVEGRFERIKKLNVYVEASQHATYERGTDTTTDVEVFEKLLVIESTEISDVLFGSTSVTIPADSMHTFDAKRNKIKWNVMVHGEIPWSPDINEEYEFRVMPTKIESRSS